MTLEESREVIPLMENMINQIEEQQELMAEMYQEMQQRDGQLKFVSGAESKIAGIKQRVAKAVSNLAKYRGNVGTVRAEGWRNSDTERGKSDAESRRLSMERISGEVERREPVIAETERGIVELQND